MSKAKTARIDQTSLFRCLNLWTVGLVFAYPAWGGGLLEVEASDRDGKAEGNVMVYRWDEAKGEFGILQGCALEKGECEIGLAPGRYEVEVGYTETTPEQTFRSGEIVLTDGAAHELNVYFGKAAIKVAVHDNDGLGRADVSVYYYKKDPAAEDGYAFLTSQPLPESKKETLLRVAPGGYRVRVFYHETEPPGERAKADFSLEDGEIAEVSGAMRVGPLKTWKWWLKPSPSQAEALDPEPQPAPTPDEGAPTE